MLDELSANIFVRGIAYMVGYFLCKCITIFKFRTYRTNPLGFVVMSTLSSKHSFQLCATCLCVYLFKTLHRKDLQPKEMGQDLQNI